MRPAAIERELSAISITFRNGNYGGSTDDEKLSKNNADLKAKLIKYGKRADVLRFPFSKLNDKMYVATSKDGRLRIYSWDTETGGTMHDFDNVFQYKGKGGKVYTWSEDADDESRSCFITTISTDTASGPIYLGVSTFIGSTSLAGQRSGV